MGLTKYNFGAFTFVKYNFGSGTKPVVYKFRNDIDLLKSSKRRYSTKKNVANTLMDILSKIDVI